MKKKFTTNFGIVFPDYLELGKKRRGAPGIKELAQAASWERDAGGGSGKENSANISAWRLAAVYFVFAAGFTILLARAFDLQVIQGKIFLSKAAGNHVRVQVDHAPRGAIFDRNGAVLAQNKPGYHLLIEPKAVPKDKKKAVAQKLSSILDITEEEVTKKLNTTGEERVSLNNDLPSDKALIIEATKKGLPGVVLEVSPIRYYPSKEITASILGYSGEADKNDLDRESPIPYAVGDKVGKAGIEATFEDTLRGVNGYTLTNVSATGEKKGSIFHSEARPGKDVVISIDINLQKFVYSAIQKKMKESGATGGSGVVADPGTGEILALVSAPSYDDNIFSKKLTSVVYNALVSNPDDLLLNRAVGSAYPPGSTFKMVSAVAGLESGAIRPDTKIVDPGYVVLGNQIFNNWLWTDHHRTEGAINVVRAIARSTDTFFFRLGQVVGEKTIQKYARLFGLGAKTGVELPGETAGLVPDAEWKIATKGEPWYPGETLNLSIGQGDLLVSPLQLTRVTAVFANGGRLITPTILKTNIPKVEKSNFLKKETIDTVREGLYQDTIGDGNVGWLFGSFNIKSAGKTGTAESGQEVPHAWYTAFAPYEPVAKEKQIVVTVQLENAGHGSEQAAPVAKQIFDWYLNHKN